MAAKTTSLPATGAADSRRGSPAAQDAAAAVVALARAARSFVLYDAGNQVIRQLLEAYRDRSREALDRHGELALEVRPFEIALGGEVVYADSDREKSMAFKLFRDGVRRITIAPAAPWEELLELLQAIALRYTAIRQQEDDVVTLLRKADLESVRILAVEGFIPAEERPEPADRDSSRETAAKPPEGWDTPLPRLPAPGPLAWRAVPPDALAALQREGSAAAVAKMALGLAADLLAVAAQGRWAMPDRDLLAFFAELRDFFLADGHLAALRELVDLVGRAGAAEVREAILSGLADPRTLDLLLDGLPEDAVDLPPEMAALAPLLGVVAALDRLAAEPSDRRRDLLLKLVLARLPREADVVMKRLPGLEAPLARALASGLASRAPDRALEVARFLLDQKDQALRLEGLESLARVPGEVPLGPLASLLDDPAETIRVKAAEVLGRKGDRDAAAVIVRALENRDRSPREAESLGRALAEIAPIPASRLFAAWLRPRSRFLLGVSARDRGLQWAAVAGMAAVPGEEAERQLRALAEEAEDDLRRHCLAALGRRRKGAARG